MPDLSPGSTVGGDFELVRPLSQGGMGAVYLVRQISTGKARALKVMHPELVSNADLRARFVQEARIGALIDSDHIVEVIAAGIDHDGGFPWLVMELLDGEELNERMEREGELDSSAIAEILAQLFHGVAYAHLRGIVHRDLKPENIFIARSRRVGVPFTVKILDFGIAKLMEEKRTHATTQAMGTPMWLAPEQSERKSMVSPATDVWALGLIAFWALTGSSYWLSVSEGGTLSALYREILVEPMPKASERAVALARTLSLDFDAWFARATQRDPHQRFSNAQEAWNALAPLLSRWGVADPGLAPTMVQSTEAARMAQATEAPAAARATEAPAVASTEAEATHKPAASSALRAETPLNTILPAARTRARSSPSERKRPNPVRNWALWFFAPPLGVALLQTCMTANEPEQVAVKPTQSSGVPSYSDGCQSPFSRFGSSAKTAAPRPLDSLEPPSLSPGETAVERMATPPPRNTQQDAEPTRPQTKELALPAEDRSTLDPRDAALSGDAREAVALIQDYYAALSNGPFDASEYFAPRVDRYITMTSTSPSAISAYINGSFRSQFSDPVFVYEPGSMTSEAPGTFTYDESSRYRWVAKKRQVSQRYRVRIRLLCGKLVFYQQFKKLDGKARG